MRSLDLLTGVSDAAHRCSSKRRALAALAANATRKLILDGLISDGETFVLKGTFATCTRCILSRWEVCDCHHIKMKKSNLFAYRIILCLVSLALPLYAKSLGKTLAILPKRLLRKWTVHSVIYSTEFQDGNRPFSQRLRSTKNQI